MTILPASPFVFSFRRLHRFPFLIGILVLTSITGLQAQVAFWQGGTGDWNTASNWSPGVPTADDSAFIGSGGTAQLTQANGVAASLLLDRTSLEISANGVLTVNSSGLNYVGVSTGTLATLSISGPAASASMSNSSSATTLEVGVGGTGIVNLSDGGTLSLQGGNGNLVLAAFNGGSGTLNIGTGVGAGILNASTVSSGTGTLAAVNFNHTDGDYYFTKDGTSGGAGIVIGDAIQVSQTGTGKTTLTATNTYTGGTTISAGTLQIGNGGTTGSIVGDVANDGTLAFNRSDDLSFGGAISGTGGLTKFGAGALTLTGSSGYAGDTLIEGGELKVTGAVTSSTNVYVGYSASDVSLLISGGGSVSDASATIGVSASAQNNTATVTGSGSTWTTAGDFNVGFDGGQSTLNIEDSGAVSVKDLKVGGGAMSTGNQVNVTGTGASLVATNNLILGYGGTSNGLAITGGATVTNVQGVIGLNAGSDGNAATVSGTGSLWTNSGTFYVGYLGKDNTLTISNGGKVTANGTTQDAVIGYGATATGNKLTVTGTGSEFDNATTFYVGEGGDNNEMDILAGGLVSTKNGRIGGSSVLVSSGNLAKVDGAGSFWNNTGTLRIGSTGSNNELDITNGGAVTAGGNTFLGYSTGSNNNSMVVDGAHSVFSGGLIVLGQSGTGNSITVKNGGAVTSSSTLAIATNAGSSGTLNIGDGGVAGTVSATSITGGSGTATVNFNHTGALTFAAPMSGSIVVHKLGAGTTTLTGANTYIGDTNIEEGTLKAGAKNVMSSASKVIMSTGSTFDLNNFNQDIKSLSGDGSVLLGSATLKTGGAADTTFAGVISGTGGLTKQGNGKFTLSGLNTYSGETKVSNGVLIAGADHAFSKNSVLNVTSNGEARLAGYNQKVAALIGSGVVKLNGGGRLTAGYNDSDFTFDGQLTGNGKFVKTGSGTMTLTGTSNDYTGNTTVDEGTLKAGANNVFSAASTMKVFGTLNLNDTTQEIAALSGNGLVRLGTGQLTMGGTNDDGNFDGVIQGRGNLIKTGTGTQVLSGTNTYSGGTTITTGTLQTSSTTALGTGIVTLGADGTLAPTSSLTTGDFFWNGGTISLNPTAALLTTNVLTMGADGTFALTGITANTKYDLLTYVTAGSVLDNFLAADFSGIAATFTLVDNGNGTTTVVVDYIGSSSGNKISNNTAPFTPTDANFTVNGQVETSNAVNSVNALLFNNGAFLKVFNSLFVTSGNFTVPNGTATIGGDGTVITPGASPSSAPVC